MFARYPCGAALINKKFSNLGYKRAETKKELIRIKVRMEMLAHSTKLFFAIG